jgi:hypothetical protein
MCCISRGARRPDGNARRLSIVGICEGGATPPAGIAPPGNYVTHHASRGLGSSGTAQISH